MELQIIAPERVRRRSEDRPPPPAFSCSCGCPVLLLSYEGLHLWDLPMMNNGRLYLKVSRRTREKGEVGMNRSPEALDLSQKLYKYGVVVVWTADKCFIRVGEKSQRSWEQPAGPIHKTWNIPSQSPFWS